MRGGRVVTAGLSVNVTSSDHAGWEGNVTELSVTGIIMARDHLFIENICASYSEGMGTRSSYFKKNFKIRVEVMVLRDFATWILLNPTTHI